MEVEDEETHWLLLASSRAYCLASPARILLLRYLRIDSRSKTCTSNVSAAVVPPSIISDELAEELAISAEAARASSSSSSVAEPKPTDVPPLPDAESEKERIAKKRANLKERHEKHTQEIKDIADDLFPKKMHIAKEAGPDALASKKLTSSGEEREKELEAKKERFETVLGSGREVVCDNE
ncbi:hypothetical protein BDZ89DRAFT_1166804 [Hymenopellis radicata]|nr:hypothetical protein BDZ89DRAFT_1166804 [Hymenopellis radicata]